MTVTLPANVHNTPFTALLQSLRQRDLKPSEVRSLVREMATTLSKSVHLDTTGPEETVAVIVVLRSGLAMLDGFMDSLPESLSTAVYHLGIFRDQTTLQPVEYYNKLPLKPAHIKQAVVLDPFRDSQAK